MSRTRPPSPRRGPRTQPRPLGLLGWPRASARRTACSRRASRAEAGRDVVIGLLETARTRRDARLRRGLPLVPRRRVTYQRDGARGDGLPASSAARPDLCLIDELAPHQRAGARAREALRGRPRRARRRHRRRSTAQRPAPRVAQRPGRRAHGGPVRETMPDSVLGEADEVVLVDLTREALLDGSARQGLPARPRRRGPQQLLPDREPRGAARDGAAAGGRGGGGQAVRRRARGRQRAADGW
jgi:hypothetical protein